MTLEPCKTRKCNSRFLRHDPSPAFHLGRTGVMTLAWLRNNLVSEIDTSLVSNFLGKSSFTIFSTEALRNRLNLLVKSED